MLKKRLFRWVSFLLVFSVCMTVVEVYAKTPSRYPGASHRPAVFKGVEDTLEFWQRFGNEHKIGVPAWAEDCKKPSFAKASPEWARRCSTRPAASTPASNPGKSRRFRFLDGGGPCLKPASASSRKALRETPVLFPARCE